MIVFWCYISYHYFYILLKGNFGRHKNEKSIKTDTINIHAHINTISFTSNSISENHDLFIYLYAMYSKYSKTWVQEIVRNDTSGNKIILNKPTIHYNCYPILIPDSSGYLKFVKRASVLFSIYLNTTGAYSISGALTLCYDSSISTPLIIVPKVGRRDKNGELSKYNFHLRH